MIYAMSDIHGCFEALTDNMAQVDLRGDNRMIFLGDYIDYGESSFQVLQYIWELQKQYGDEKVIVLKGNHEQMFLEWINDFRNPYTDGSENYIFLNDWLRKDFECGAKTISTFFSEDQMSFLNQISRTCSLESVSSEAVQMLLSNHDKMICWMQNLPLYYETDSQIFVHAGVDEDAGEYWMWGASDDFFLWKFPATKGKFYKTVIAGHVGTGAQALADDQEYHDIFYDGESHYYIDGSVYMNGKLLLLGYDEDNDKYYQVEKNKMIPIEKFEML